MHFSTQILVNKYFSKWLKATFSNENIIKFNKNLAIAKNNLSELDDIIVASEDPKERMRLDLLKISKQFYIHFFLEKRTKNYTIK